MEQKIPSQCPHCDEIYMTLESSIGKKATCKSCGTRFDIVTCVPRPSVTAKFAPVKKNNPDRATKGVNVWRCFLLHSSTDWEKHYPDYFVAALVLSVTLAPLAAISARESRSTAGIFAYPLLMFTAYCAYRLVRLRTGKSRPILLFTIAGAVMIVWGRYDNVESRRQDQSTVYLDRYNRWTGNHLFRTLIEYDSPEHAQSLSWMHRRWTYDGPMAGTGKPHGHWTMTHYNNSGFPIAFADQFYWYGDKITEGEWHLRNR